MGATKPMFFGSKYVSVSVSRLPSVAVTALNKRLAENRACTDSLDIKTMILIFKMRVFDLSKL
jgi:hypothetical protein